MSDKELWDKIREALGERSHSSVLFVWYPCKFSPASRNQREDVEFGRCLKFRRSIGSFLCPDEYKNYIYFKLLLWLLLEKLKIK